MDLEGGRDESYARRTWGQGGTTGVITNYERLICSKCGDYFFPRILQLLKNNCDCHLTAFSCFHHSTKTRKKIYTVNCQKQQSCVEGDPQNIPLAQQ